MLFEIDRCILEDKDLPHRFWVEVVYCENYLLNHILTQFVPYVPPVK